MTVQMFKEKFDGKYHGVAAATLLPPGWVSDGKNVRKVSETGGWKPRKGCSLNNTTALGTSAVLSLHKYEHPRNEDYHFLAQYGGNLYDATNDPPAAGTSFGSSVSSLASSSKPGFSDVVGESWIYADGEGAPVMWGGDEPFCTGFVVDDNGELVDYTRFVRDERSDTSAVIVSVVGEDAYYVCSPCVADGIKLDLGVVNDESSAVLNVEAWRSGSWTGVSDLSDGTEDSSCTHGKDGTISWTAGTDTDTMKVIAGIMGYWYKVYFGTHALKSGVTVISCKVTYDPARISNKWSGVFEIPLAVRFYDQSATEYVDYTGKLTNESVSQYLQLDAATTSDFVYVKFSEPLCGIAFGVVPEYEQTGNAQVDSIDYWDGDSWVAITTGIVDETLDEGNDSSFAQSGTIWWNAAGLTVRKRTMEWDSIPGYWYRVSWDNDLDGTSDDCRVYMVLVATFPEALPGYDGVVEFKARALYWGDPEYPNRLRISAKDRPDCLSGSDSGYTDQFGDMSDIVAVKRFYNEVIVWKKNSVWLMEGFDLSNFGVLKVADTIGCCAPKTALVVEAGHPGMHADEPLSIAIWCDTDGVYVLDGRKPRKVSLPVDHYFNPEFATCVAAASLDDLQAFIDPMNNEYHLLLNTTTELVYNYITDEWYPPWVRNVGASTKFLKCGLHLRGTDGRYYTYGGNDAGMVFRLENDTSDKNASNADVAIEHSVKTRGISAEPKTSVSLDFDFRKAWIEAKAITSPTTKTITTNFYKDLATNATALTAPAAIDLGNSGYSIVVDGVDTSQQRCKCFQLEFVANRVDLEMEIYSFLFQVEARGEFGL